MTGEGSFFRVADSAELAEGCAIVRPGRSEEVAIFRARGALHAIGARCPHRGGPLGEGTVFGERVVCPWHGWAFDLPTGECLVDVRRSVRAYEVEERAGGLWLGPEKPADPPAGGSGKG